jgi:tRNA 5-methylaminomethyl-2-thiouridine biosynthesis bifunctional protein
MTTPQHHGIVVIGAGIAGATIAHEIATRGHPVCLIDSAAGPATQCSSHAHAIAHPHITKGSNKLLQLTRIGFTLAVDRWGSQWLHRGALQPAKNEAEFSATETAAHLQSQGLRPEVAYPVSAEEAMELAGVSRAGVWYPNAGMLNLAQTTKQLAQPSGNLRCIYDLQIDRLERNGEFWILLDSNGKAVIQAEKVIVAAGLAAKNLLSSIAFKLPLKPVRGQLNFFQVEQGSPWFSRLPTAIICGDGYCLPRTQLSNGNRRWIVGSSFDENETDLAPLQTSAEWNREQAAGLIQYREGKQSELLPDGEFVGVRCVAGDRLPIIGALPQRPGIFVASALGSRGIVWAALAAKLIADQVLAGDFALLTRLGFTSALAAALAPDRFLAGALPPSLGALASNSNPILPSGPNAR